MTVYWSTQLADLAPSHLVVGRPGRPARAAALGGEPARGSPAGPCWCAGPRCCRSSASSAATSPARPGRSTAATAPCTASRPVGPAASRTACPSRCSPRRPRPTTGHDENITFDAAATWSGTELAEQARDLCLAAYSRGARAGRRARASSSPTPSSSSGFIDGELALCDEILTPGLVAVLAGRPWQPGPTPPSFDKQPVRDWLAATGWDKQPPPPPLPAEVVAATGARYVDAYERITGRSLADWYGAAQVRRRELRRRRRGAAAPGHRRSPGGHHRAGAARARLRRASHGVRVGKMLRF